MDIDSAKIAANILIPFYKLKIIDAYTFEKTVDEIQIKVFEYETIAP